MSANWIPDWTMTTAEQERIDEAMRKTGGAAVHSTAEINVKAADFGLKPESTPAIPNRDQFEALAARLHNYARSSGIVWHTAMSRPEKDPQFEASAKREGQWLDRAKAAEDQLLAAYDALLAERDDLAERLSAALDTALAEGADDPDDPEHTLSAARYSDHVPHLSGLTDGEVWQAKGIEPLVIQKTGPVWRVFNPDENDGKDYEADTPEDALRVALTSAGRQRLRKDATDAQLADDDADDPGPDSWAARWLERFQTQESAAILRRQRDRLARIAADAWEPEYVTAMAILTASQVLAAGLLRLIGRRK